MNGKVKWFNVQKGYGFLSPEEGGKDVFFHITQVKPDSYDPLDNDAVTFDMTEDRGKPAAMNVRPA